MENNVNPLFTIVIPTYNRSSDLVRCLNSLVSQTYKNFEVVVCDNASTDNTKEVISEYKSLLNLHYVYLMTNSGGPARPRNVGASNAKGEWICFLDSDDWYTTNKLEYISKLDLKTIDFVYHDLNIVKDGVMIKRMRSRNLNEKKSYLDLLLGSYGIPTSSVCVRKNIFLESVGFEEDSNFIGLEDYHLWIELARSGTRFKYIAEPLGNYFLGNENLSLNDESRIDRYKFLFKKYIDSEKNQKNQRKILATMNYHIGWIYFNRGKLKEGITPISYSLRYGSFSIKLGALRIILKSLRYIVK